MQPLRFFLWGAVSATKDGDVSVGCSHGGVAILMQ